MSLTLYDLSIPVLCDVHKAVRVILEKGDTWATERKVNPKDLLTSRLHDDMQPLCMQIVHIVDTTNNVIARLVGLPRPPKLEIQEISTFGELYQLLDRSTAELVVVNRDVVTAKANDAIPGKPFGKMVFMQSWALPNIYFHLNMTYAILRSKSVPLGKMDYLEKFGSTELAGVE
ncbi:hypothetical protein HK100_003783 [Physocladia obscura]|uniref:DUF1993 domain-containing protein n=1 Tax=Physocladia obscura TaxID=109957 RepID=A0AAD5XD01_9FUNG|nr:hypothetical protein HK100_003783 [Physocladia obscura]